MFFEILTLFPSMFEGAFSDSIIKRAVEKELVHINIDNIRDYSRNRHNTVDDYPYGGDPGMLMKPEPVARCIEAALARQSSHVPKVVYFSPCGDLLNHDSAMELSAEKSLILICGRYKGLDQRIIDKYVDRELSIGDYVLSGGEIPAMVLVDTLTRLLPGVLGNPDSAPDDSFYNGLLSAPQYTRPEEYEGVRVPDVLLSGNHKLIREWRKEQSVKMTKERRPDLWQAFCNSADHAET
jgi:tRNA (guanine37-N1)-methyltransferase